MFAARAMTPNATAQGSGSVRRTLRSFLSTIFAKIGSGRNAEANHVLCMELYHTDETKLKEMGLTRMDVIRLLETKGNAVAQETGRSASLPTQPRTPPEGSQRHRFPVALLVGGKGSF